MQQRCEEDFPSDLSALLGGPPRLSLEGIEQHPDLPSARNLYLTRFLDLYVGDPFLIRLLIEAGRFFVYNLAIVIEGAYDPRIRETWPTVGLLKQKLATLGVVSDRQVDHLIDRLCGVGFLTLQTSPEDGRVRLLIPTEKLREHDREWLAVHYAPLTVLYPHHDYAPVMKRDPHFQRAYRRICIPFIPLGARLIASVPDMMLFLERAGGYMILAALLKAASASHDLQFAALPYGDVGDRFGVSRTQVRKLLSAAETVGLVRLHSRGGHKVEILPRLWSSHDRSIAGGMYIHDMLYMAALRSKPA